MKTDYRKSHRHTTRDRYRWVILTVLIAAVVWSQIPIRMVHAFQVCARNCGVPPDAACLAAVVACETKIHAYNIYMEQMGTGVPRLQLPAIYQELLSSRYPLANFSAYRFGFGDRQPANNATTDCTTTYFNNSDYVNRLQNAAANPDWFWLLHEVTHVEQCTTAGGREAYAKRWWDEMEAALAAQGRTVNFSQPPDQLANQIGAMFLQVHDAMPMERAADNKANLVQAELMRCCIDGDGKPIRSLKVTAIDDRLDAGSSIRHILAARVENGDSPFTSIWRIKSPGDLTYVAQPQNLVNGLELLWTPKKEPGKAEVETVDNPFFTRTTARWRYDIEVEVAQQATTLERLKFTRTIVIADVDTVMKKRDTGPAVPQIPKELPAPSKPGLPSPGPVPPKPPGPGPGPVPPKPPIP